MAAAGQHDLWLKWIDALIDFEGVLGRSSLLGVRWDSNTSQGELPVVLLRGSTLTVLAENPAWMVSEVLPTCCVQQVLAVLSGVSGLDKSSSSGLQAAAPAAWARGVGTA